MQATAPSAGRATAVLLLASLVLGLVAMLGLTELPEPVASSAPPEIFSAQRAQSIIAEIARAPHPVGSNEHQRVRAFLCEQLNSLGFAPELQPGVVNGVELTNVIVRIAGSAPTGTLLCVAHYDSVPTGPGASDDSIGVACWLETLRALKARGWHPKNDVMLLLSDAEEYVILGARRFADSDRSASIACVINLEAVGNGGPARLFQLGANNGACVRAFIDAVPVPRGSSLANAVYRRMPNNSDLTAFLERGIPGFNFAITEGGAAYHAPFDTLENLDPRSVQHMGDCALTLAASLAAMDLHELQAADVTFFDVPGLGMVRYSRTWDIALAAIAVVLTLLACRVCGGAWTGLFAHALRHARDIALVAIAVALLWWLLDTAVAWFTPELDWVAGNRTSGALLFAGIVGLVVGYELMRGAKLANVEPARVCAIALIWGLASMASLQWLAGASFVFTWPLSFSAIAILASRGLGPSRGADAISLLGFAASVALGVPILHSLLQLFQRAPLMAILLISATLASGVGLFAHAFQRIGRELPWTRHVLFGAGVFALLASVFVARILGWRQGALFP